LLDLQRRADPRDDSVALPLVRKRPLLAVVVAGIDQQIPRPELLGIFSDAAGNARTPTIIDFNEYRDFMNMPGFYDIGRRHIFALRTT